MISQRLELALERLRPSDWERFERLASVFLASEFPELRTLASPSGDGGRDAELFASGSAPNVVIQYSVSENWTAKIEKTINRLRETNPGVLVLIYATNQVIGARADELRTSIRVNHGISLDIRDRSWFIERVSSTAARQQAAEELAIAIVDPLLQTAGVGPHVQSELSTPEAIAAVTFLGLQWQDEVRAKGLTKIAFEALVRAVLVNTDSANRVHRSDVHVRVSRLLPDHPKKKVSALVDGALSRLAKHTIKHWQKEDEFCLAHDEVLRLNRFRVEAELGETQLLVAILRIASSVCSEEVAQPEIEIFAHCIRNATDAVMFERSQAFAMAVHAGTMAEVANADFDGILSSIISGTKLPKRPGVEWLGALRTAVREVLTSIDLAIQRYLRSLSDSYTLLAFLRQTPDVQEAVGKMFSTGSLWIDANIILPLIADTLAAQDGDRGRFARMIDAARDAGLKLYVTPGVIEEVERHMNMSLTCLRLKGAKWLGSMPYLLERYLASGRSGSSFSAWLETFRGDARPLDDLAEYLEQDFSIKQRSLQAECDQASEDFRFALQRIWYQRYQRKQEKYGIRLDEAVVTRLVNHDVECCAGVVHLRSQERPSPFGYSAWWLTVDPQAFDLKNRVRPFMTSQPPDSPVMSADFLVNYLAFGPVRTRIAKDRESHLPLLMVLTDAAPLTPELIAEAEALRAGLKALPERVIRRQVRDYLDRAKSRLGPVAQLGMDGVDDDLEIDELSQLSPVPGQ